MMMIIIAMEAFIYLVYWDMMKALFIYYDGTRSRPFKLIMGQVGGPYSHIITG